MDDADLRAQLEALHPHSFGWALSCCDHRREDAEDVLHDTYVAVLAGEARFGGSSAFRTWLFGVIRNKARSRRRRERVRALLGLRHATRVDTPAAEAAPDAGAIAADRRERTRSALQRLPRRQRDVLLLVFYHELSVEEAASVMRVSVGSARTHYARGKSRMRELLGADAERAAAHAVGDAAPELARGGGRAGA